jgi:nitroreductase
MTERRQPAGLERLRADYEAAKARLAEIGFTCEGSLIERYTSCKNPNCRCQDPDQRHGPYWQISWKQNGKTVSKILPAGDAALYQEWIANRRALEAILDEMRDLSPEPVKPGETLRVRI